MTPQRIGRVVLALAAIGTSPWAAFADEVVHFTNGAEMTVRSHTVEKDKQMVRLDLGANSFIAFPMAMVDKIESSGRDVFLNPVFHPANQAIAAGAAGPVTDNSIRGVGEPNGSVRYPSKGKAGAMLGETADSLPVAAVGGQPIEQPVANSRRIFNPAMPPQPGAGPQVIMPAGKVMPPINFAVIPTRPDPPPPPPANTEPQEPPPPSDPDPENPPESH